MIERPVTILEKKTGEKYYEPVREFAFTNEVKKVTQGNLF